MSNETSSFAEYNVKDEMLLFGQGTVSRDRMTSQPHVMFCTVTPVGKRVSHFIGCS